MPKSTTTTTATIASGAVTPSKLNHVSRFHADMDPVHIELGNYIDTHPAEFPLLFDVMRDKYFQPGEKAFPEMAYRVVKGIYAKDPSRAAREEAYDAMIARLWMPAGRILAGAGTEKRVTLLNCYVTGTVEDSMEGIMREHTNFALTMQQGGGDGIDISPVRPEGAILKRTGTAASGPLPFLFMWDSMCKTIRSAGDRRGAMMVTMADTHPDLLKFIKAKHVKGHLKNFNMSILISDAFKAAVDDDEDWLLHFPIDTAEPRPDELRDLDFVDDQGVTQYVYDKWRAKDLWEHITESTYEYSEPGIIFIDRVNTFNNLWYCEEIRSCNPCGEQPLPPHGACDLGHIVVSRMVMNPFTAKAEFNWELLRKIVRIGVRFLDNVLDVSNFPLPEQAQEALDKRRIGLGETGLADALIQLGIRYGSHEAQVFAEKLHRVIQEETYSASSDLAAERGSFLKFDAKMWLSGQGIAGNLSNGLREKIAKQGIRNGVLNTMAPCGTSGMCYYYPCSGIEPMFSLISRRNVRQYDGETYKAYNSMNYASMLYLHINGHDLNSEVPSDYFPSAFVTVADLDIHDHILMQSRVQRYVDASVSKTVNIPKELPYEQFVQVYDLAYSTGCKGCTTYRPSDVRGSILEDASKPDAVGQVGSDSQVPVAEVPLQPRPKVLHGVTHQIKWPNHGAAYYLTINFDPSTGQPYEMFITSKDGSHSEWTTALSLMVTAIFRKGGDTSFISHELKQIQSFRDGAFVDGRYVGSLPALIGRLLESHLTTVTDTDNAGRMEVPEQPGLVVKDTPYRRTLGDTCPRCNQPTLIMEEGCFKCTECFYSKCS